MKATLLILENVLHFFAVLRSLSIFYYSDDVIFISHTFFLSFSHLSFLRIAHNLLPSLFAISCQVISIRIGSYPSWKWITLSNWLNLFQTSRVRVSVCANLIDMLSVLLYVFESLCLCLCVCMCVGVCFYDVNNWYKLFGPVDFILLASFFIFIFISLLAQDRATVAQS